MRRLPVMIVAISAVSWPPVHGQEAALSPEETLRLREFHATAMKDMSHQALDGFLGVVAKAVPSVHERVLLYAQHMLGTTTYRIAKDKNYVDLLNVVNTPGVINRSVAMALARNWEEYFLLHTRLHWKDGEVREKNMHRFTLPDWVESNAVAVEVVL